MIINEHVEAMPGERIDRFAARLIALAWERNAEVVGEHNQHRLTARPGATRAEVLAPWNDAQRRSYFGGNR